jgi:hypothetical protein
LLVVLVVEQLVEVLAVVAVLEVYYTLVEA